MSECRLLARLTGPASPPLLAGTAGDNDVASIDADAELRLASRRLAFATGVLSSLTVGDATVALSTPLASLVSFDLMPASASSLPLCDGDIASGASATTSRCVTCANRCQSHVMQHAHSATCNACTHLRRPREPLGAVVLAQCADGRHWCFLEQLPVRRKE
jgi:hypothetical protein